MAKRLKKEKVNVDIINFGEEVFYIKVPLMLKLLNICYCLYFLLSLSCYTVHMLTLILSHTYRK